jgi:hypothetical protein
VLNSRAMHCTLDIPHLIPPREAAQAWRELQAPALKALLARARHRTYATMRDVPDLSCLDLDGAAPLLAASEGLQADRGYWLCATPVHVQMRHHTLVLADPDELALGETESAALAATLAEHLQQDGLTLLTTQAGRWYLHCDAAPALRTTPLQEVIGRSIDPHLPQGPDALRWHRLLTELQMLLHAHPVNDTREGAGLAPVNSVWLWGGGTLPEARRAPWSDAWSDDPAIRALARHAGCAIDNGNARFPAAMASSAHYLFSFHALAHCVRRGDWHGWQVALSALERDWFAPLRRALHARTLKGATLISGDFEGARAFRFSPWDRYKIFNKIKYLK